MSRSAIIRRYYSQEMVKIISRKDVSYLSQQQAIAVDQELFSKYGFKVEQLMELAGLASASAIFSQYTKGQVLVLCGPGNNGGDGFVCARHLQLFGFQPKVVYPKESKNELMKSLVKQCEEAGIEVSQELPSLGPFGLIVDALFGFSFKPPVRSPFLDIIKEVANSGIFTCSIDIPSGWDVEKGAPCEGLFIRPHSVVSLTAPKTCMANWTGPHFVGGRFVPPKMVEEHHLKLPLYPDADQIVKLE